MLEQLLSETSNFSQYRGGLGYLYLDGKVLELLSVYLGEILEVDILMGERDFFVPDRENRYFGSKTGD